MDDGEHDHLHGGDRGAAGHGGDDDRDVEAASSGFKLPCTFCYTARKYYQIYGFTK